VTYTLFYTPGTCSLVPDIVLREAGLPLALVRVDLGKRTASEGDWLAINPKGYVPALRLPNGELLTETAVMVQYLADQVPEKKLAPELGTFERVRFDEMLAFITTELHKGMSPIYSPKATDDFKASLIERLTKRYAILGEMVGDKTWLTGDTFTIADAYATFVLRQWKRFVKLPHPSPHLASYHARLTSRPSAIAAAAAEQTEL
jgi:glutathione S-transferase